VAIPIIVSVAKTISVQKASAAKKSEVTAIAVKNYIFNRQKLLLLLKQTYTAVLC
jgi:hypothetical protein